MSETINGASLAYPVLSEAEMEVFEKLKTAEVKGIWALAVENVISDFDVKKFRKLICEMKSQNLDSPPAMKNILGDAYESVMSL